ncbi:MAG: DUF2330 domain-containing protein, partial [Nitrospinota bacterium]|nr:DUF2330 domain-containing protein [Nitrospinota bacterium]
MRLRFFSFWVLAAVAAISLFSREASAISGIYLAQRWSVPEPGPFVTVMARNGNRTVITLLPGASGGGSVFTLLIPVSGSLSLEGVGSASPDLIQSLDNFTAPRLLYRDDTNPCQPDYSPGLSFDSFYWRFCPNHQTQPTFALAALKNHGVSGVYDFRILDPKDPTGTLEWLARKNYILPHGFAGALEEFSRTGAKLLAATFTLGISSMPEKGSLPPIVMELDEPAMTLPPPFPLAKPSDLVVFVLSGQGMPIIENYEARRLPNDGAIPMAALNRHFDRYTASLMDPSSQYGKGKVSLEFHSAIGPVECRDYFHFESALAGYGIRQKKPSGLEELAITRFRLHHSWRLFPESIVFKPEFSKGGRILPFTWVRKPFAGDTACAGGEGYLENYESWTKESANMITDQYLDPDWRETLAKEVETISLFNSAAKGDIAQLEKAVAAGMNINMTGAMGATFLSSAANHGAKNSALWLLQKGANVEPPWICNGNCPMPYTPLTLASERGDLEMMSILLAYGADIEAKA